MGLQGVYKDYQGDKRCIWGTGVLEKTYAHSDVGFLDVQGRIRLHRVIVTLK